MIQRIFGWLAGLTLVLVFLVAISPDLFRGYVFSQDPRSSGKRTYDTYCIGCHGDEGLGDGSAAEFLNPKPRNFVNGEYKFFHFGEAGPFPSDQSLEITVRNGIAGSAMPAFPLLTDQEIRDVSAYIKSLRGSGWDQPEPIQAAPETVFYEGETGEALFTNAGCQACHQFDLLGAVGGVGPNLSVVGSRLSADEIKQSILEPNAAIAEECPAGPCPAGVMPPYFGERLTPDQIDIIAQYLAAQQ